MNGMATATKRFAVRLTAEQDALSRRNAQVEGSGFYALPSAGGACRHTGTSAAQHA